MLSNYTLDFNVNFSNRLALHVKSYRNITHKDEGS